MCVWDARIWGRRLATMSSWTCDPCCASLVHYRCWIRIPRSRDPAGLSLLNRRPNFPSSIFFECI